MKALCFQIIGMWVQQKYNLYYKNDFLKIFSYIICIYQCLKCSLKMWTRSRTSSNKMNALMFTLIFFLLRTRSRLHLFEKMNLFSRLFNHVIQWLNSQFYIDILFCHMYIILFSTVYDSENIVLYYILKFVSKNYRWPLYSTKGVGIQFKWKESKLFKYNKQKKKRLSNSLFFFFSKRRKIYSYWKGAIEQFESHLFFLLNVNTW